MIEKGYLCDYTIHVPVFTDDPTNKNICEYLIKNYRNMIIYCNSQKEGKKIVDLMNNLQTGIAEYIDCKTGKRKRNDIIRKFKEGKVPYLVNVRILVEGFDAPITKGVIFLHLPRSQTTLVQIIGRALRLHKMKKIANIILPFSSKEDEKNIGNFLRVMARNDSRIRRAFNNKKVGGYICIDRDEKEDDEEEVENEIELKYEMVYSSLGGLKNWEEIWMQKLEEVKRYISNFRKKPTHSSRDDKIRRMGVWIDGQKYNYDKDIKKCRYSMKNPVIHSTWKKILEDKDFSFYLYNSKEKWKYYYNKVIDFININNKNPSIKSKNNDEIIISRWLSNQKRSFDIDYSKCRYIMKDIELYNLWKETCENNNYSIYFKNNIIENWKINYYKLISYIDNNHKSPSQNERDKDIKSLGIWTSAQRSCYDTNISKSKKLFKNKEIHNLWSILYNNLNYSKYIYKDNILIWKNNFELVKIFIDKYNITPSTHSKKFDEKRLGHWILDQRKKYNIDMNLCSGVMNNEEINLIWSNILIDEKYGYFFSPKK